MNKLKLLTGILLISSQAYAGLSITGERITAPDQVTGSTNQDIYINAKHEIDFVNTDNEVRKAHVDFLMCATNETCYSDHHDYRIKPHETCTKTVFTTLRAHYHYSGHYEFKASQGTWGDVQSYREKNGSITVY